MSRLPGHPQAVSAACVCDICIAIEHENAMRIVDDLIRCCTVFALLSVGPRLPLRPRKDGLWLVQGDKRRDIKGSLKKKKHVFRVRITEAPWRRVGYFGHTLAGANRKRQHPLLLDHHVLRRSSTLHLPSLPFLYHTIYTSALLSQFIHVK